MSPGESVRVSVPPWGGRNWQFLAVGSLALREGGGNCHGIWAAFGSFFVKLVIKLPQYWVAVLGRKWQFSVKKLPLWQFFTAKLPPTATVACFFKKTTDNCHVAVVCPSALMNRPNMEENCHSGAQLAELS